MHATYWRKEAGCLFCVLCCAVGGEGEGSVESYMRQMLLTMALAVRSEASVSALGVKCG